MAAPELDPLTGQYTTGHSWNGIKELRNPVPGWWLTTWLCCIAFAIGYAVLYPSFVGLNGAHGSWWQTSARQDLAAQTAELRASQAGPLARIRDSNLDAIAKDAELAAFARAGGRAAFAVNCIACHGPGAGGQIGQFPSLIDDDWIWGGKLAEIEQTIRHGIRSASDETRTSMMPAFGGMLQQQEIEAIADFVLALAPAAQAGTSPPAGPGANAYQQNCASCHGASGEGSRDLGAPRLNDTIWLYGGRREQIIAQISRPRMGMMPAFGGRLPDEVVKMLALYVHGLGGGEATPEASP